jgi:hypothetical protein
MNSQTLNNLIFETLSRRSCLPSFSAAAYNPFAMRRIMQTSQVVIVVSVLLFLLAASLLGASPAHAADAPSLVISQLKITSSNGQFVTLYNATNTELDMSKYQLEYFNNYDLSKATSSKLIALSGTLPSHSYYVVNDDSLLLCYQLTVDSISLGLSSTAGMVEVLAFNQNGPGGSVTPALQDYVGWSKTAASGAQTLPSSVGAFLQRQPTDAQHNPNIITAGAGSWLSVQPDDNNPCNLVSTANTSIDIPTGFSQLLPGSEPSATIINIAAESGQAAPSLPASDIGLMAPSVTELLPNPEGTGNDNTDEFIELYNPNTKAFDLSGFILQTGLTTTHNFTLPPGTNLPAHGFAAFYSAKTGLSMSNTGGQSKLLDPFGNSISASGAYGTAKDGQTWALAKGKWYWTSQPTPGKANIIKQPADSKKSSKKTSAKTKGASTKTAAHLSSNGSAADESSMTPIHPWVLALIGGLALLYGTYEYRSDVANYLHQLRRNLAARRGDRG